MVIGLAEDADEFFAFPLGFLDDGGVVQAFVQDFRQYFGLGGVLGKFGVKEPVQQQVGDADIGDIDEHFSQKIG